MRAVVELSGIKDMITKSLGTNNPVNPARATIAALQALQTADSIAQARGQPADEMERLSRRGKKPEPVAAPAVAEAQDQQPGRFLGPVEDHLRPQRDQAETRPRPHPPSAEPPIP